MGRDRVLAIREPVWGAESTGTLSRENCSASRTTARGDARPPCVKGVEDGFEHEDEDD